MKNQIISLALVAGLAACSGGNPFDEPVTPDPDVPDGEVIGDGEGTGINRDGIPPGTASPSPGESLFRSEPTVDGDGADAGNGFATGISYNSADDTFSVDNLAFDGDAPYNRGTIVSSLNTNADGNGEFAVYEGLETAVDPVNNDEIRQFVYRAVYGQSRNSFTDSDGTVRPTTQFAIVRTGSYVNYGFGGFIYQRDTSVSLPNTLQATFRGKSAGLRDFENAGGLQYTTGDVTLDIDFDDFNDGATIRGDGVKGTVSNRRIIDLDGNDVTSRVANELGEDVTAIPNAVFVVGPDVLDNNGDIITEIQSQFSTGGVYETGTFYAIVSGENPDEVVGVFVLESENTETISRDTSGFIVYRDVPTRP
ncbi:hypothetical protein [uncultured Sulfitobacter sp.]|uniref:hypothetical protein n=1 Tax=uncultured Sulfitobacter sp. TaxID=191468 RepID=UPI0026139F72|nr:hypothetical protein [uncultured Sulfitobacter sp.]